MRHARAASWRRHGRLEALDYELGIVRAGNAVLCIDGGDGLVAGGDFRLEAAGGLQEDAAHQSASWPNAGGVPPQREPACTTCGWPR